MKKDKNSRKHYFFTNTEKENNFYTSNGYLHVKNLLNKKKLIKVRNDCKFFCEKENLKKDPVLDIHSKVSSAYSVLKDKNIKKIAQNLIKSKQLHGIQSAFFSTPKNNNGIPPHQDDFFLKAGLNNTMNIWVPLINVNSKNGTLAIFLKSHMAGVNKRLNLVGLNENYKSKFTSFKKYKIKKMNCKLGDVVFICNQVFHNGGYNSSNKKRYILSFTYLKNNKKFFPGKTAKRKKFKIY